MLSVKRDRKGQVVSGVSSRLIMKSILTSRGAEKLSAQLRVPGAMVSDDDGEFETTAVNGASVLF